MSDTILNLHAAFEADVRRAEPDLWLASRLVSDSEARTAVLALYAVHVELAKVAGAASSALAGEIRLAWWREEVEALAANRRALGHPALQALSGAALDVPALDAMIEARHAELEPQPFRDEGALTAYLDGVDGGLMRATANLLSPGAAQALTQTGRAWGWTRLLRERPGWRARGRDWVPAAWGDASEAEIIDHVRHRALAALKDARDEAAALPVKAFPATAYAALTRAYLAGREPSDLEKRARLIWASLRGRI